MKKIISTIAIISMAAIIFLRCGSHKDKYGAGQASSADTNFNIPFSPFVPHELDSNADSLQLVEFAWKEFIALNWKSSFYENNMRDCPDTSWSYDTAKAPFPILNVWETYAHRSELRPWSDTMLPFDAPPHYSIGYPLKPYPGGSASFTIFHNLDENNEIGSCNLYAHVNTSKDSFQVLYQAKVNRDEYNYIRTNYPHKSDLAAAAQNTLDNIKNYGEYYKGAGGNTCNCPPEANVICLPAGTGDTTGSIEIKSAWRELTPYDDSTQYFRRRVIYYVQTPDSTIYYANKTYILIALHIIHKTKNYPAFIFATWEHDNVITDQMGYKLLDTTQEGGRQFGTIYTPSRDPIHPVTAASTRYVHAKLPRTSIWQHYHLVGVQAMPTNDRSSFSFFLSNYVVESDSTLFHFNGSGFSHPHDTQTNVLFKGKPYSMGGCQGCHGAAQHRLGTDFSFLLDTGINKPVDTPDVGKRAPGSKLIQFRRAEARDPKRK